MSAPEPGSAEHRAEILLGVARASIESGLRERRPVEVDPSYYPPGLREPGASFVTLRKRGELRGCTGSLEALRPLVVDVARTAYRSAFGDPRFRALAEWELPEIEIQISILGPMEPICAGSEEALLVQLRPGRDGLALRDGTRVSTFLPAVWESLPEPRDFVIELKRKAGLPPDYWSPTLRFDRYGVEELP